MVQSELALAATHVVSPSTCTLYHGNCLEVMPTLNAGSVHMVFADLPYGATNNTWDKRICLDSFWLRLKYVCKFGAAAVYTTKQRLAAALITSNPKQFRYDLVWHKNASTGYFMANKQPLRAHETILIFSERQPTYNPQKTLGKPYKKIRNNDNRLERNYNKNTKRTDIVNAGVRHPTSILSVAHVRDGQNTHPTQKPIALLEWLIATYTNIGETVLDPCMGSGVAGVACARLGRSFIGIEKDETYFNIAKTRIEDERKKLGLT